MEYTPPHERIRSENEAQKIRAKEDSQRLAEEQEVQVQRIFSAIDVLGENQMTSVIEVLEEVKVEKRGKIASFFLSRPSPSATFDLSEYTRGVPDKPTPRKTTYNKGGVGFIEAYTPKQYEVAEVMGGLVVSNFFFKKDIGGDLPDYTAPLVVASDGRLWSGGVFKSFGAEDIYGITGAPFLTRGGLSHIPKGATLNKIVQELESRV